MTDLANWSAWGPPLVWTLVTLAVSWAVGYILGVVLASRLSRWISDRQLGLTQSASASYGRACPGGPF